MWHASESYSKFIEILGTVSYPETRVKWKRNCKREMELREGRGRGADKPGFRRRRPLNPQRSWSVRRRLVSALGPIR
jgi:hypothetical protein